ncbi:hypothetical protein ACFE04_018436 [Oxalis oulophora]
MAKGNRSLSIFFISYIILFCFTSQVLAKEDSGNTAECGSKIAGGCHDKAGALKLKFIAFFTILLASIVGVTLPLFARTVSALQPDKDLFVIVKCFASGVILATGYMHVMPDSWEDLSSTCLPETPWRKFPFTTFVAMVSAILTMMCDSMVMAYHGRHVAKTEENPKTETGRVQNVEATFVAQENPNVYGHQVHDNFALANKENSLMRNRVVAQVLELGIVVHSVVIGLSMGASDNKCTIKPLIAALCFHQLFEGMGLGGAEYKRNMKAILAFFFSFTTPFGLVLGYLLSNIYSEDSPTALIVVGLLNACSAGLLNYMALVDLLAADFMGPKLQSSFKLQGIAYVAVFLGAGLMALMAKWA